MERLGLKHCIKLFFVFISVRLPIPAYLLALSYLFLSVLSMSMLVGLRTRRTRFLLAWILLNLLLICPEAGMVLFMAIYFWVSPQSAMWNIFFEFKADYHSKFYNLSKLHLLILWHCWKNWFHVKSEWQKVSERIPSFSWRHNDFNPMGLWELGMS